MQLLKVIQSTQVSKLPLDESGLNLSPPNAYLSMHSRFTSQAFKCIGCSFVCSCHRAVSRFVSQTSPSASVHIAKCYVGNFFLTTLPAYSRADLHYDCLLSPLSASEQELSGHIFLWQTNNTSRRVHSLNLLC